MSRTEYASCVGKNPPKVELISPDWSDLEQLYIEKHLSCNKIASIKGCTGIKVYQTLKKMRIPTRTPLEAFKYHSKFDWSDLYDLYANKQLTPDEIGVIKGCGGKNVSYMLNKCKIATRSQSEAQKLSYAKTPSRKGFGHPIPEEGHKRNRSDGYVLIRCSEHPRAGKDGYALEHILVWEKVHNKPVPKGWHVHHVNGIGNDNRPRNLVAVPPKKHRILHYSLDEIRKQRIRELEAEVELLNKALEKSQMIFTIEEN